LAAAIFDEIRRQLHEGTASVPTDQSAASILPSVTHLLRAMHVNHVPTGRRKQNTPPTACAMPPRSACNMHAIIYRNRPPEQDCFLKLRCAEKAPLNSSQPTNQLG